MKLRTNNKKTPKKFLLIALAIIAGLTLVYGVFAFQTKAWPFSPASTVNLNPTSSEEKSTGEEIKSDSVNNNTPPNKATPSNDISPSAASASVLFSATTQDNTTYHIRVLIETVLDGGTCALSLTKSGEQTYTANADIQSGPSSSTCKGFDIPLTDLSPGTWVATVTITSGSTTGTATKDITVQ